MQLITVCCATATIAGAGVQSIGADVGTTMTMPPVGVEVGVGLRLALGSGTTLGACDVPLPAQANRLVISAIATTTLNDGVHALSKRTAL